MREFGLRVVGRFLCRVSGSGTTGQGQLDVAAIGQLEVDVTPFVDTTRERFTAVLGSASMPRHRRRSGQDCHRRRNGKPAPLSLLTPDTGPEEMARWASATGYH